MSALVRDRDAVNRELAEGGRIRIDGKEHFIVKYLAPTDELVTEEGISIFMDQIELVTLDELGGDVEAFLAAPTFRRKPPAPPVARVDTIRCPKLNSGCKCDYCYVTIAYDAYGSEIDRHHFVDSPACRCSGQPRLVDCECL